MSESSNIPKKDGKPECDIIHLDDNENDRILFKRYVKNILQLSYLGLSCLKALEDALPEYSAKVFVIDGKFPRTEKGEEELLAPEAIETIKKYYPDSRIILFSGESNNIKIFKVAEKYRVEYVVKSIPIEYSLNLLKPFLIHE